jgi:hypothetical protein
MATKKSTTPAQRSGGITFLGALTILFIGLKLAHVIDWSWLWVLSPLWLGIAVIVGFMIIGAIGIGLWALVDISIMLIRKRPK